MQNRLESIAEQWELLTQKTSEKSMKLKEANRQRTFIAAVKDLDFWLGEVEALLTTDELGQSTVPYPTLVIEPVRINQCSGSTDPHVFGPPGSGSISQRYGSGSGSFYHQAKIVRKTLIPTFL